MDLSMQSGIWLKRLVLLAVVAGAVWGGWTWWKGRSKDDDAPRYRTETVDRGVVNETVTATGTVSAVTTVQVGSQVSGIVARLYADFNSRVSRGQLLAELDPTPFQATVEQRRADVTRFEVQMRAAEVAFKRQQRLLDQQLSAEADFDAAKADFDAAAAQVQQAQASLRQAETNLGYTKINSPIDGVVVARQYDVGQTVAASFQAPTLFTIAQDLTKMQVQADVDQADIGKIRVGQKASFTVDAYPDQSFKGEISQVRLNATVSQNVISYPVILTVDNAEEKLRPQMTANVTLEVDRAEDVLRVPNAALRFRPVETAAAPDPDRAAARLGNPSTGAAGASKVFDAATGAPAKRGQNVYVLEGKDALKPVSVRTGITDGRFTAIVGGDLKEGDTIVVGIATAKVESTGSFPGASPMGGGRPGGGGGRRF
jgi:HlyD family secretion protein